MRGNEEKRYLWARHTYFHSTSVVGKVSYGRTSQPHLLPLMSCSLCCCAGAAISIPRFGDLRGIRILRAARNRSSSRIIHELWGILSARWPAARVIYGVKVVMEERIVSSSSCWGCPVDDGNYREPSFSFSSFSSDLFFSFFSLFFPTDPLLAVLTAPRYYRVFWRFQSALDGVREDRLTVGERILLFPLLFPSSFFKLHLLCGFLVFCSIFSRLLERLFRSDFFLRFFYRWK